MENIDQLRTCNVCKKTNLEVRFRKGEGNICAACRNEQTYEYMRNHKEKYREHSRNWSKRNPEKIRNITLNYLYNISLDDYNKLLLEQNNVCAICSKENIVKNKPLAVDHCHTTGKVRGLLCYHCNDGLGKFKDNINSLNYAVKYLEKHNEINRIRENEILREVVESSKE